MSFFRLMIGNVICIFFDANGMRGVSVLKKPHMKKAPARPGLYPDQFMVIL